MKVTITYCKVWNYHPRAASLAEEIKNGLGHDVELIPGSGGVFDVKADGKLIFSKFQSGDRFPEKGEVVKLLKDGAN